MGCGMACVPANECQTSTCVGSQCVSGNVQAGTKIAGQTQGDCQSLQCDGSGSVAAVLDPADPLNDGKECTIDVCQGVMPKSLPVAAGTACTQNEGKKCNAAGDCVACLTNADCATGVCQQATFTCVAPSCNDAMKNGTETDVDCGGAACPKCSDGKTCASAADCAGGVCKGALTCCTPVAKAVTCGGKCGTVIDNCGQSVDCGGCTAPATCGGGGVPNVCGSTVSGPWAKAFQDPNQVIANDLVVGATDTAVIAGAFYNTTDFGGGPVTSLGQNDAYLAKLDANGNHVWSRRFGGTGTDGYNGVAVDPAGNVVAGGVFNGTSDFGAGALTSMGSDVIVAKYDTNGNTLWTKSYGDGATQQANAVATDANGNILVGGHFASLMTFGGAAPIASGSPFLYNGFVVKLSPAGSEIWSKSLGTPTPNEILSSLVVDAAGNVYALGYYSGTTNVGGPDLPTVPVGTTGIFVVKMDANGNHVWSRGFVPTATFAFPGHVVVDAAGNVYATAGLGGDVDAGGGARHCSNVGNTGAFVAKLDAAGNHVWSQCYAGTGNSVARGVTVDAAGNVLLTGSFSGTVDFGGGSVTAASTMERSFFLLKVTSAGAYAGSRLAHSGEGYLASLYASGQVSVSGTFGSKIDLGAGQLTSTGIINVFVAKLTAP